MTGRFVLGELIRVIDGRPYSQYVREAIFTPLGMSDCHIGMSPATFAAYHKAGMPRPCARCAQLRCTAPNCTPYFPLLIGRIAELYTLLPNGKIKGGSNATSPSEVSACIPAANGRAPACQWIKVYEMLLRGGVGADGTQLLQPTTVARFTRRERVGMFDEVTRSDCDWSLGCFVGAKIVGPYASPDVYGHGGSQSSIAFCDPDKSLVCCLYLNTRPGPQKHEERLQTLCTLLYEDLGIGSR